ncbi:MAG TPA: D-glycero-beta-D-manno-heptose 1-phosphate adenylyltransferase [Saprospiraceae bacterium]|nr:D-glycero-beta-D-manno-heptose 1-phosphate adenylyltransferase [Saprospiraceae bacterium]HPN67925.1 D-glycero-beta-D-manno-heptose 1-phosphate adenylyltransferase [Saprospiraceae bacterium]
MAFKEKIIFNYLELKERLQEKADLGQKIVFTNGCFDLLHPGHTAYLEEAKSLGDILVVAINSDESVKRLKGNSRPILPQNDRALILAALESTDFITVFSEDTPYELIGILLPDVLVKGGDWQPHEIIGSDLVLAKGGNVQSLSFIEGNSTTNIEQKIILSYLAQFSESKSK